MKIFFIGGMPGVCTGVSERTAYFKSFINTYIERDVMKLISASSELQFRNFISIVALRTAQELHYDEIAGSVGIDVRTFKRWIYDDKMEITLNYTERPDGNDHQVFPFYTSNKTYELFYNNTENYKKQLKLEITVLI